MLRYATAALILFMALAPLVSAQTPVPDSLRIARLTSLGHLWGVVRYFHPALGYRNGGWDDNTATAVESVRAASTTADYATAIRTLLATLNDPATELTEGEPSTAVPSGYSTVSVRWDSSGGDNTLVVSVPHFDNQSLEVLRGAATEIQRAQRVVFDLRGPGRSASDNATWMFDFAGIDSLLPATSVIAPPVRRRIHVGFPDHTYDLSGVRTEIDEKRTPLYTARPGGLAPTVVFLVNTWSDIPQIAFAMHQGGQAAIVVDGSSPMLNATAQLYPVALGEGLVVSVRVTESGGLPVDTVIQGGPIGDAPLEAAIRFARRGFSTVPAPLLNPVEEVDPLPPLAHPSAGYRVLAAYQWWNAIQYFYPYKDLIGEDWNEVLPTSIAKLEMTRNQEQYGLALSEMVARIHDSHGSLAVDGRGALFRTRGGLGIVGARLQYIDDEPVVISVADESVTRASGLAVGDVIVSVDGKDVSDHRLEMAPYISASTPQALNLKVEFLLRIGPPGTAEITVRGRGDTVQYLSVPRIRRTQPLPYRTGPIIKMLPENIGYVDLQRLTRPMVDSMFDMLSDTRAIIFDNRGYPRGTMWRIAPRLTERTAVPVSLIEWPLVTSPDPLEQNTKRLMQRLWLTSKPRYLGKTVLLIDEHAVSQSEALALHFVAANGTTVIGSPSQGANGTATRVAFAGNAIASFTGISIRHPDGRQLQRLGIQPDILVRPTVEGLRAGRDEVLERAIVFLNGSEQ